jgi:hypothetical protein
MGSYPRREKAEREARERADTVPVLDCQSCGALTSGERFRYYADQIVCEACDGRNPQSRRRIVPRVHLQPRNIAVNFVGGAQPCRASHGARSPHHARPSTEGPERRDPTPTARVSWRYAGATRRVRQLPRTLGSRHCPDHTSAGAQEPAPHRLLAALTER